MRYINVRFKLWKNRVILIENHTTGCQHTIAVSESIGEFQLIEVAEKTVTLAHNGEEIRLTLSPIFFLNAQRR